MIDMAVKGQQLLDKAKEVVGNPYIYGYEVDLDDPQPKAADCSELVEWTCHQLGVRPYMPDGAVYQFRHCINHNDEIEIDDAIVTPGALLFFFSADPLECRPKHAHVAFSQGDGTTLEARGKDYGIGSWNAHARGWTHAALIPGVKYPGWPPA